VLALLLEHPGDVVTREELREKLWPADTFVDFDTGLNSAIKKLRDALCDSAAEPRYIETLPRRGYRFIAEVKIGATATTKDSPAIAAFGPSELLGDSPSGESALQIASPVQAGRRWKLWLTAAALGLIVAVVLGINLLRRWQSFGAGAPTPIQSIAVLPLENLSGDPSQEYFSDGMTDALITELAQVRRLKVISRTSVMHYKGARQKLPEIARELQVDAIVEGTVERDGNHVKIRAQLIRAATDTHVWAGSYVRVQQDVLGLQAEVAEEIAKQISKQLTPVELAGLSKPLKVDPEAYEDYLKGTYFFNKMTPDAIRSGLHYYQAAIGKDPSYASAYAKIAECYLLLSMLSELSRAEASVPGRRAAEKAAALDENLGEAHQSLGNVAQWYDWDWSKAEREYRRAIDLNPNIANTHLGYSSLLLFMGKPKASAEELRKARELDPISLTMYIALVHQLYLSQDYEQALLEARKALEIYPDAPLLHSILSGIYIKTEEPRLGAEEALKTEEYWGASQERMASLRNAYEAAGIKGLLRRRIELNRKSSGQRYLGAYDIACDSALLDDKDQVFYWLERVYREHDISFPYINVDPVFDSVRADPRYLALVKRAGISQ
jgi:TolB-like protein